MCLIEILVVCLELIIDYRRIPKFSEKIQPISLDLSASPKLRIRVKRNPSRVR